jgi:CRP-like cAMP-binding protein
MENATDMLVRKLSSVSELSGKDKRAITSLPLRLSELQPDQEFASDEAVPKQCCLLLDGFMHRYKVLPNGMRQIFAFHTPGDMPDLHSLYLRTMDHSVAASTRSKVGFVSHQDVFTLMQGSPGIAAAIWRDILVDAAIFRMWMMGLGQRTAHGHLSHFFCEIFTRLEAVGLTTDHSCALPITQEKLGEAFGLSTVHINRTLQELRGEGLIELRSGRLRILDWEKLVQAAQFNPAYLHLRKTQLQQ